MSAGLQLARSFLFVPADRIDRLPKALASGAHAVIVDLEDAVAPEHKAAAREGLLQAVADLAPAVRGRLLVRLNAVGTAWHGDDVRHLPHGVGGVVLPKSESGSDVARVAATAGCPVLPLVESAQGFENLNAIAAAAGVLRLIFGHLDFQVDLGLQAGADERELDAARLAFVLASRGAGLAPPVDGVTVNLDDTARLQADAQRSRRFGFGAKLCIHPKQVSVVNETLGPTAAERDWARRVVEAAATAGAGAFRLDGQMVDAPVLLRARRVLG